MRSDTKSLAKDSVNTYQPKILKQNQETRATNNFDERLSQREKDYSFIQLAIRKNIRTPGKLYNIVNRYFGLDLHWCCKCKTFLDKSKFKSKRYRLHRLRPKKRKADFWRRVCSECQRITRKFQPCREVKYYIIEMGEKLIIQYGRTENEAIRLASKIFKIPPSDLDIKNRTYLGLPIKIERREDK